MTQNNLYMEDDNMRLYVDVQPLFIDELENSKNSAAASAASAAQSEANARTWKNDIIDYKTNLELFYAQARDGITNSYNNSVSDLTSVRNLAYDDLNSQKNSILTSLNNSLNSALNSISTNGQNYVNLAREYAEQAQITVDNRVSKDLLIQSNACKAGSVSTIKDILTEVYNYAHSCFDKSKFTIVGSPNITDDGIVSGFNNSNYLTLNNPINNNFTIIAKVVAKSGTNYIISSDGHSFIIGITNLKFNLFLSSNGTSWDISDNIYGTHLLTSDNEYFVKLIFDGTQYILSYSTDGVNYTSDITISSTTQIYSTLLIRLGNWSGYGAYSGSLDLKQFSITVDGVPVFSGNKTGIDTIIPYNSTNAGQQGSLTVNDEGIASGFSTSNYLKYNLFTANSTPINATAEFSINIPSLTEDVQIFFGNNSSRAMVQIGISSTGYIQVGQLGSTTTVTDISMPLNQKVYFKVKFSVSPSKQYVYYRTASTPYTLLPVSMGYFDTRYNQPLFFGRGYAESFSGTMDLSDIKVTNDDTGEVVYQPCLKIPYTESKTGSKVVNAIYRDRVNDMAEQFGFANYYTLDEDNGNFTLPQVELYGLIGRRTLRDSYRNGINYWELYSNRDLEQGGSCTSGVEVTFTRPFADTNYVLSVPYSAKSATAFTPTQTGDWIAKGKGIL